MLGGGQNHNNGQGWAPKCQPTQRGATENNQDQNGQENLTLQNQPQTQSYQQHEGCPPMCYECRGLGHISHNCPSTHNYAKQGQVRDNLNSQWGSRTKPSPWEQPNVQSARSTGKPVRFDRAPKYHHPDPVVWLIDPPNEAQVEVNGVAT